MKHHLVVFALVTLASEVFAVQGTLVTESEELKGDIRWDAEKKHYVVSTRCGDGRDYALRRIGHPVTVP